MEKFTKQQLTMALSLLQNLKSFENKKLGIVNGTSVLVNFGMPGHIIIKYEKEYASNGEMNSEHRICTIDPKGRTEFIESKFADIFQRSAFLSECKEIDLSDTAQFQIID